MKGTIRVKKLSQTGNARCFISEKDYDKKLGGEFYLLLEPFDSWEEPMFYWSKNTDGTYTIEGEGYIVDSESSINSHKRYVKRIWGNTPIKWVEVDSKGNVINNMEEKTYE